MKSEQLSASECLFDVVNNQNSLLMAKKKIKPSDLDLTPKAVGTTNENRSTVKVETNDLHCPATELDLCLTDNTICVRSDYNLCDTDKDCKETIACPGTNNCVDSRSAAIQCCAHTGNDCVESGYDCPETGKTCKCQVLSDACPLTNNNVCGTSFCQTENGLACPASVAVECPETSRHCQTGILCIPVTMDPCNGTTDDNCEITEDCQIAPMTTICQD